MHLSHESTHFFLSSQVGLGVTETMGLVVLESDAGKTVGFGIGALARLGIGGDVAAKRINLECQLKAGYSCKNINNTDSLESS